MSVTIRTKFLGILALQMMAVALVGWVGIAGMGEMNRRIKGIYEHQFLPSRIIANANNDIFAWKRAIFNRLLSGDVREMESHERTIDQYQSALSRELASYREEVVDFT